MEILFYCLIKDVIIIIISLSKVIFSGIAIISIKGLIIVSIA